MNLSFYLLTICQVSNLSISHHLSVCVIFSFFFIQSIGEFLLTDRDMHIKPRGKIYSINEGYSKFWDEPVKEYVDGLKYPKVSYNTGTGYH